jgi:sulfite dehydrogenase (quinone) subunit SoeA
MIAVDDFPLFAITQRPMAMYHSWHSQNAWLRQIFSKNWLYMNRATAERLGLADGDYVWVTSHHARIKCPVRTMEGVNPNTVWTWNAIGKRKGAWNLAKDAPEGVDGFLLNHTISDLLPDGGGHRYSNSDPVTGQAAWYDLRVRIEKATACEQACEPSFPPLARPPGLPERPDLLRFDAAGRQKPWDKRSAAKASPALHLSPLGRGRHAGPGEGEQPSPDSASPLTREADASRPLPAGERWTAAPDARGASGAYKGANRRAAP